METKMLIAILFAVCIIVGIVIVAGLGYNLSQAKLTTSININYSNTVFSNIVTVELTDPLQVPSGTSSLIIQYSGVSVRTPAG